MRNIIIFFILLTAPLQASDKKLQKIWKFSISLFTTSQVLDIHSSIGGYEMNRYVGTGMFGTKQIVIKSLSASAIVGVEWLITHKKKEDKVSRDMYYKIFSIANFASTGVTGAIVYHNYKQ